MNLHKKLFYNFLTNKKLYSKLCDTKTTMFKHSTSKVFFNELFKSKGIFNKKYFITKNTNERIRNMDLSKINPIDYINISDKEEIGFIFDEDNLQTGFCIKKTECILVSGKGNNSLLTKSMDQNQALYNMVNGIVYFNYLSNEIEIIPTSPISILLGIADNVNINLDKMEIKFLKKEEKTIIELLKNFSKNDLLNIIEIANEIKNKTDSHVLKQYIDDFLSKYYSLITSIKQFTFIHFAKEVDKTFISDNSGLKHSQIIRGIKSDKSDIIKIDSFYNENINVINPFAVKGHFRNQPIGEGRNNNKLIYVDSFMKTGYNRKSVISK